MPFKIFYLITLAILFRAWSVVGVSMSLFSERGCFKPNGYGTDLTEYYLYYRCTDLQPAECCSINRRGEPVEYYEDPSGQFKSCEAVSDEPKRFDTTFFSRAYRYRAHEGDFLCGRSERRDVGYGCINLGPWSTVPFTGCKYYMLPEDDEPDSDPDEPGFMDMKGLTSFPLHFNPQPYSGRYYRKRADNSKCVQANKMGMVINGTVYEINTNSKEHQQFKATKDKNQQQKILITYGKKDSVQQNFVSKAIQKKPSNDKGSSKDDKGKPSDDKGKSNNDKGKSKDDKDKPKDKPKDDKGKPSDDKEKSSDDKGKSKDDKNKPNNDKDKPSNNKGKSKGDKPKRFRKL